MQDLFVSVCRVSCVFGDVFDATSDMDIWYAAWPVHQCGSICFATLNPYSWWPSHIPYKASPILVMPRLTISAGWTKWWSSDRWSSSPFVASLGDPPSQNTSPVRSCLAQGFRGNRRCGLAANADFEDSLGPMVVIISMDQIGPVR